jgi:hypothetical protein
MPAARSTRPARDLARQIALLASIGTLVVRVCISPGHLPGSQGCPTPGCSPDRRIATREHRVWTYTAATAGCSHAGVRRPCPRTCRTAMRMVISRAPWPPSGGSRPSSVRCGSNVAARRRPAVRMAPGAFSARFELMLTSAIESNGSGGRCPVLR